MKKHLLATTIAVLAAAPVHAEDYQAGVTFSPQIGHYIFDSERGLDDAAVYGAGLGYQFANPFALEFTFLTLDSSLESTSADVDYDQYRLDALYHFAPSEKARPYLAAGAGEGAFQITQKKDKETQLNLGAGVKYFVNESVALRGDARSFYSLDNEKTDYALTIGLLFLLGAEASSAPRYVAEPVQAPAPQPQRAIDPDTDGDGVRDSLDKCPNTTPGVMVDASGCELDSDNDGVVNSKDACPDTSAGARVDAKGCYEMLQETRSFNLKVTFANNSVVIPDEQKADIASLAKFMTEYPQTKVVIEGHTDDRGSNELNQRLSEKRAKAVADVLVADFGIDAGRVSAVGKGEESPIADNNTVEGRAQNRRVVAVVSATVDVIKK